MNFFSKLKSILLNDFGWKILSVVLAAAIWFTVHRNLVGSLVLASPTNAELPGTNTWPHAK